MVEKLTQVSADATARAVRNAAPMAHPDYGRGVVITGDDGALYLQQAFDFFGVYTHPRQLAGAGWRIDPTDAIGRACLAWAILRTSDGDMRKHLEAVGVTQAGWSVILTRATMGSTMNVAALGALIRIANAVCGGDHDAA